MRVKRKIRMFWTETPDIIPLEDLATILGCRIATARNKFDETNFPIIKNIGTY